MTFVKEFTKRQNLVTEFFFFKYRGSEYLVNSPIYAIPYRLNGRSHYFAILYSTPFLLRFSMGFCYALPRTPAWIQTAAKSFDPVSGWDSFREVRDYTPSFSVLTRIANTGFG